LHSSKTICSSYTGSFGTEVIFLPLNISYEAAPLKVYSPHVAGYGVLKQVSAEIIVEKKVRGTWGKHCPSVYMDKSAGPYLFKQEQSAGCYLTVLFYG
jgi:hypothetical protein